MEFKELLEKEKEKNDGKLMGIGEYSSTKGREYLEHQTKEPISDSDFIIYTKLFLQVENLCFLKEKMLDSMIFLEKSINEIDNDIKKHLYE